MARPSGPVEVVDVERELDRLYQQPIGAFTAARKHLLGRLKASGQADAAERVLATTKPTASAWATNQVYWCARPTFDALVEAGDRLLHAQEASLRGHASDLAEAMLHRQRAVNAFVDRAAALLVDAGLPVSPPTRQRLAVNADALAAHGSRPSRPPAGRLSQDLQPPGFSLLAALAPPAGTTPAPRPRAPVAGPVPGAATPAASAAPGAPPATSPAAPHQPSAATRRAEVARAREAERREARARAEFDLARAESELRRRRTEADRAERDLATASSRATLAARELELARAARETAERRAAEAEDGRAAAAARADDASAHLREAEEAARTARKALDRLKR